MPGIYANVTISTNHSASNHTNMGLWSCNLKCSHSDVGIKNKKKKKEKKRTGKEKEKEKKEKKQKEKKRKRVDKKKQN